MGCLTRGLPRFHGPVQEAPDSGPLLDLRPTDVGRDGGVETDGVVVGFDAGKECGCCSSRVRHLSVHVVGLRGARERELESHVMRRGLTGEEKHGNLTGTRTFLSHFYPGTHSNLYNTTPVNITPSTCDSSYFPCVK